MHWSLVSRHKLPDDLHRRLWFHKLVLAYIFNISMFLRMGLAVEARFLRPCLGREDEKLSLGRFKPLAGFLPFFE
jgi:hypothetical protein